jgi:hypothetical protein
MGQKLEAVTTTTKAGRNVRSFRVQGGAHLFDMRVYSDQDRALAATIVQRFNAHETLVSALRRTVAMLEREYGHFEKNTPEGKALLDLRAALSTAEGRPE